MDANSSRSGSWVPLSSRSDSSLFSLKPEGPMTLLKDLCFYALLETGEPICGYNNQPASVVEPMKAHFSLEPSYFFIDHSESTGLWDWRIKIELGQLFTDPEFCIDIGGSRTDDTIRTLRHDIVCMALTTDPTDVKLRTVFPALIDSELGRLSPDIYVNYKGVKYFVEIGTTMAADPSAAEMILREKLAKYSMALEDVEHDEPCFLIVIIVSRTCIVSNFEITPEARQKLFYHLKLAEGLENRMEGLNLPNLMRPLETHIEAIEVQIRHQLDNISLDNCSSDGLNITPDFIRSLEKPADKTKVIKYFNREVSASTKSVMNRLQNEITSDEDLRLSRFEDSLRGEDTRQFVKAVVHVPLFLVPRRTNYDTRVPALMILAEDGSLPPVLRLWTEAIEGYCHFNKHDGKFEMEQEELYYTDPIKQEEVSKRAKETRNLSHRCKLPRPLDQETLRTLAMDGIWAKKWMNDPEKVERERLAAQSYHLDTDTTDIEKFLNRVDIYEPYEHHNDESLPLDLLTDSFYRLNQKVDTMKVVREIMRTKLACSLEIISAIALELTVSLKQHTGKREVLLKKLGHYDVYLLIVPTKASEHIFYSLYVPGQAGLEVLADIPFRSCHRAHGGGVFTEFCSFRPDKLSNQATITESFIAICSYYAYHYRLPTPAPSDLLRSSEAMSMINATLLVRLENKLATEETITVSRYMFMEILKSDCCIKPDPFRLLDKLPTVVRSRLQLFFTKRLIAAFKLMNDSPIVQVDPNIAKSDMDAEEDVPSTDYWDGLINPYTMCTERSASRIVSLFYLGYAVDKDQIAQANSDFKIIEKAVRKDVDFDPSQEKKSNGSWDNFTETPSEKQFSINVIKWGVELMQSHLRRKYGDKFRDIMGVEVIKRMTRHMTHELATLKASARIEHLPWDQLPSADSILKDKKARLKVIEAIMLEIKLFDHNPFLHLSEIVSIIESSSRGVICDLFKKNQHGGLREIYVTTIKSRIMALFLEICSRVLCEQFDVEAMTHPDHKMEVVERHKIQVGIMSNRSQKPISSYYCSADKKNWNNNLVMPALGIPLFMLLPDYFHPAVQRTLNMWNHRLIQLPSGVLKLLTAGVELNNPTYQRMLREFDSPGCVNGEMLFPNAKSGYCQLRRGMMQGILHYTSSLLHVSYLYVTKSLMVGAFKVKYPNSVCVIDQMCSSDDSATIITVVHPMNHEVKLIQQERAYTEIICDSLKSFCSYSCFTNSEKSTMGSFNQLEFNSEFMIGNNLAVPILKWVFSAFNVSESENLLLRQQTFYNLLSQVSASGLPSFNTTIIQIAQGLLHYKLMGSETNPHFPLYVTEISSYPDPTLGYFVLDNIYCPGTLGFSYHHWLHNKMSGLFIIRKKSVLDGSIGFNPEGGIIETFLVRHGDSRRYTQLLETISHGKTAGEIRDLINADPKPLYNDATSRGDAEIKILAKALLPGTAQSLTRGVPFLQAVATSIYGLQTYSFTRVDASYDSGKGVKTRNKISLIGEIHRRRTNPESIPLETGQTAESLSFPNYRRYQDYLIVLRKYEESREVPVAPMRHRKSKLRFSQASSSIGVSLYELVCEKWAGKVSRHSIQLKNRSWLEYKSLMPWLDDSIDKTLENSPFLDHVELHNFVSSSTKPTRTVIRIGPAIRSSYPAGQIDQVARRSYKEGIILAVRDIVRPAGYQAYRDRRTAIGLALEIPIEAERELMVKVAAREHKVTDEELSCIQDRSRREAVLSIIVAHMNGMADSRIQKAIEDLGQGLFISWIKDQSALVTKDIKTKKEWKGEGVLVLSNKTLVCRVTAVDDRAVSMITNSIKQVRMLSHQIIRALKEQGLQLGSEMIKRAGVLYLTKNGVQNSGPGTVITEALNNPKVTPPENWNMQFDYQVKQGELLLKQTGLNFNSSTILTYRTLPQEFDSSQDARVMTEIWKCWYYQARLNADCAISLIVRSLQRNIDDSRLKGTKIHKESSALVRFLRETLLARLRQKGYSPLSHYGTTSVPQIEIDVDPDVADAMRRILDEADDFMADDADEECTEVIEAIKGAQSVSANNDQLMLEEIAEHQVAYTDLQVNTEPTEFATARLSTRYCLIQFWDELITQVSSINPSAWRLLLQGREVAGIKHSRSLIALLLRIDSRPAEIFGRDIDEDIDNEAMRAIYAVSSTRSSRRSATRLFQDQYKDSFDRAAEQLLKSSEELKGKDELLSKIFEILKKAHDEVQIISSVKSGSSSSSSSEACSWLPVEEVHTQDSPVTKVSSWMQLTDSLGPGTDYEPTDDQMNSDELEWLYNILRNQGGIDHSFSDSVVATSNYLKGHLELPDDVCYDLSLKNAYFIHLSSEGETNCGHWVSVVSGVNPDYELEYYDASYHEENVQRALKQLRVLFPKLERKNILVREVQPQITATCGHACFMRASHRVLGHEVPKEYTEEELRRWVTQCLRVKFIFPFLP